MSGGESEYESQTRVSNILERGYFQCPDDRRCRTLPIESAEPCNTHVDNSIMSYRNVNGCKYTNDCSEALNTTCTQTETKLLTSLITSTRILRHLHIFVKSTPCRIYDFVFR